MTRPIALLFIVFAAGCIGKHPLEPGDACPCAPGWECDPLETICVPKGTGGVGGHGGGATGGMSGTTPPGTGGGPSCGATCATPAGAVKPLTSVQAIYAAVEGTWQICSDMADWTAFGAPSDVIGIEFGPGSSATTPNGWTVGGDAFYLVQGASGPVRGTGFDYQLTYSVADETTVDGGFQFNLYKAPTIFTAGGAIRYSPCPTELQLGIFVSSGSSNTTVLVPF